jgi:hypothetical protein
MEIILSRLIHRKIRRSNHLPKGSFQKAHSAIKNNQRTSVTNKFCPNSTSSCMIDLLQYSQFMQ